MKWPRRCAGLAGIALLSLGEKAAAQAPGAITTLLPQGDVFAPLLADPKQPEFLAGIVRLQSSIRTTTVGAAAFGENIGVARWSRALTRNGIQIGLAGGVFAQFDLGSASIDLLNADYLIGIPLTYRRGDVSLRLRPYHQSSHLGDEYLLQERPQRVNLSFESLEGIVAADFRAWRVYGGGEYIVRHEPSTLASGILHGGLEYRPGSALFGLRGLGDVRLAAGLDVKSWGQNDWAPSWSVRAGIECLPAGSPRRWSLLLSWYRGQSPYGQFYEEEVRYFGAGLHLAL